MAAFLYFLATFAESGLSVFGVRAPYDTPRYTVIQTLAPGIELRAYPAREAVETDMTGGDQGAAFGRLFRYITGANAGSHRVAMTVPVEEAAAPGRNIPMTVPVDTQETTMRFFLPADVAAAGAPAPTEAGVRLVTLPAVTLGVIRYSGIATQAARAAQTTKLRAALAQAGKTVAGAPSYFSYDPPFAIPFLRRNEVALEVK
jgi:hypothetical protein